MVETSKISKEQLAQSIENAHRFADKITAKRGELLKALSKYQSTEVTLDEIDRSVKILRDIEVLAPYFTHSVGGVAAYLPSNLPLYSYVLFAAMPSIMASEVNIRPNQIMQDKEIFKDLNKILHLDTFFPNVSVRSMGRVEFNQAYIPNCDAAIFTGTPTNGRKILSEMKDGALLILNGTGHNPIVVTETSDVNKAVEGAVYTKGFNCGQDCAGPDAILVHSSVANEFIEKFINKFTKLKKGSYTNPEVRIGPIDRASELMKFGRIFHEDKAHIVAGGNIDFRSSIVDPTVLQSHVMEKRNYKECFGPVAYIHVYDKDKDLAYYFEDADGQYVANKMYVTVYGDSKYLGTRNDAELPDRNGVGILIKDKTIHDIEYGNAPYGGYSTNASSLTMRNGNNYVCEAKPILIPQALHDHLVKGVALQDRKISKRPKIDVDDHINATVEEFKAIAHEVFGDHLTFAFVFGSVAKNQQVFSFSKRSDLDTFICLKDDVPQEKKDEYIRRIVALQKLRGFAFDPKYPAEIVTFDKLKETFSNLSHIHPKVGVINPERVYDALVWTQVFNDAKKGFIGDGRSLSALVKLTCGHLDRWKSEVQKQLAAGATPLNASKSDDTGMTTYGILKRNLSYEEKGVKLSHER